MKSGIVICTRLDSQRIPRKALFEINGKPILQHLIDRLIPTGLPIILAVPPGDCHEYMRFKTDQVKVFNGPKNDPLMRMALAADYYNLDNVVRICHDKIFISAKDILHGISKMEEGPRIEYLSSNKFTPGTKFEIISTEALIDASDKFKNVEHVTYAVLNVVAHTYDLEPTQERLPHLSFLIDYPEDITMMQVLLGKCGSDVSYEYAVEFLIEHPFLRHINRRPKITYYTCAYNAEAFIERAMDSVVKQDGFRDNEYIIVDDCSTDNTSVLASRFTTLFPQVKYIRNGQNIGLAASSNVALKNARGDFIVRMDADDFFSVKEAGDLMVEELITKQIHAVYPANYKGSSEIQQGNEEHHAGGAMFRTNALKHLKFNDELRGYEGLDLYLRAQEQLKIGYIPTPLFFYTQRPDSMSKTNLAEREEIKKDILRGRDEPEISSP